MSGSTAGPLLKGTPPGNFPRSAPTPRTPPKVLTASLKLTPMNKGNRNSSPGTQPALAESIRSDATRRWLQYRDRNIRTG